jgi:Dolichyl-phosphate-mannose-protein mannosyltransferase
MTVAEKPGRFLPLILALGVALRVWGLGVQSFTMDEITELELARLSLRGVITAADGFPPLYSMLLHGWLSAFDRPEAARWLSVLLGVLAILAIERLGHQAGGETVGRWSALLLAVSPIHIWYSQEVRSYGLLFLVAVVALWRYEVARHSDRPADWLWYGVATVAGFYTHYYFALLPASLAIAEAVRPGRWARLWRFVQVHAAAAIFVAPVLLLLRGDLAVQLNWPESGRSLDLHALAYTLFSFLAGYSVGPSLRELHTARPMDAVRQVLPWAVLAGSAAAYLGYLSLRQASSHREWRRLLWLVVLPFPLCWVLGEALDLGYKVRFVLWCLAPLLVLLAFGLAADRRRWPGWTAFGVLAAVSLVALVNRANDIRYRNEDARGAARRIEVLAGTSDPVFVVSGYMAAPLDYYLQDRRILRPLFSDETVASPEPALRKIRDSVVPGKKFWLVYSRPFDGDPQGRLRNQLRAEAGLRLRTEVAGMELYEGTGW